MKKCLFFISLVLVFCIKVKAQESYYPLDAELPPNGKFVRVGPMKIIAFTEPSLSLELTEYDAAGKYYGYIEFGSNFLQTKIYKNGQGQIITYVNDPGTKLVSKNSNKYDWIEYQKHVDGKPVNNHLKITGCPANVRPFCFPFISYYTYETHPNSKKFKSVLMMSYDYKTKMDHK